MLYIPVGAPPMRTSPMSNYYTPISLELDHWKTFMTKQGKKVIYNKPASNPFVSQGHTYVLPCNDLDQHLQIQVHHLLHPRRYG